MEVESTDMRPTEDEKMILDSSPAWNEPNIPIGRLVDPRAANYVDPTVDLAHRDSNDERQQELGAVDWLVNAGGDPRSKAIGKLLKGISALIDRPFAVFGSVISYLAYREMCKGNAISEKSLAEAREANRLKREDNDRDFCDPSEKKDAHADPAAYENQCRPGMPCREAGLNSTEISDDIFRASKLSDRSDGHTAELPLAVSHESTASGSEKAVLDTAIPYAHQVDSQYYGNPALFPYLSLALGDDDLVQESYAFQSYDLATEVVVSGLLGTAACSGDGLNAAVLILFATSIPDITKVHRHGPSAQKLSLRRVLQIIALIYLAFKLLDAYRDLPMVNMSSGTTSAAAQSTNPSTMSQPVISLADFDQGLPNPKCPSPPHFACSYYERDRSIPIEQRDHSIRDRYIDSDRLKMVVQQMQDEQDKSRSFWSRRFTLFPSSAALDGHQRQESHVKRRRRQDTNTVFRMSGRGR